MEDLVSRFGEVSINEVETNNRYIRSFIASIVDKDFRRMMVEKYKLGLKYITFLQYEINDIIVFGLFHRWQIVPFGTIIPNQVASFVIRDLASCPSFWDMLHEAFPDFFIGLDSKGDTYKINIYWEINC